MRVMTQEDVDVVLGIELAVQAYPWTRGNFMDALNHGYECRVAEELLAGHPDEDHGEIRGYAILMQAVDEAELLNIGVAAAWQRKGLGRMMLNEMLQKARAMNIKRVFLEVRPSNVAAIALYRCSGFDLIGVRRGYYQNAGGNEDALVMSCDLKDEENGQA
jgi:[ribosomal protein S18]-alanine N-acetyltransferase